MAGAWLLLDDGAPTRLVKVEGSWWVFDARGRTRDGHWAAMRAAMNTAPGYGAGGTGERQPALESGGWRSGG